MRFTNAGFPHIWLAAAGVVSGTGLLVFAPDVPLLWVPPFVAAVWWYVVHPNELILAKGQLGVRWLFRAPRFVPVDAVRVRQRRRQYGLETFFQVRADVKFFPRRFSFSVFLAAEVTTGAELTREMLEAHGIVWEDPEPFRFFG